MSGLIYSYLSWISVGVGVLVGVVLEGLGFWAFVYSDFTKFLKCKGLQTRVFKRVVELT